MSNDPFNSGLLEGKVLAESILLEALKRIGLGSNPSSIFTGAINIVAKEAILLWEKKWSEIEAEMK